jgi:GrpB-like predicted nucleotidyltransferase (UPF0157 family)
MSPVPAPRTPAPGSAVAQRLDEIVIVDYNPSWPGLFAEQAERVNTALQPWLTAPTEHIGSTAVPGLPAKPIIDMLARVGDFPSAGAASIFMERLGWVLAPEPSDVQQRRWSYCFPSIARRTHHLHVVEESAPQWRTWLAFRDHLRAHPADAAEYARIKTGLSQKDSQDRIAYRAGKAPFIEAILARLAS